MQYKVRTITNSGRPVHGFLYRHLPDNTLMRFSAFPPYTNILCAIAIATISLSEFPSGNNDVCLQPLIPEQSVFDTLSSFLFSGCSLAFISPASIILVTRKLFCSMLFYAVLRYDPNVLYVLPYAQIRYDACGYPLTGTVDFSCVSVTIRTNRAGAPSVTSHIFYKQRISQKLRYISP